MIIKVKKTLNFAEGKGLLDIDTIIEEGNLVAITGPSGSGKTILLRIIAGLSEVDSGYIHIGQKTWLDSESKINLPPQKRKIGYVFQNYALFPNMTIRENLTFALEKNQTNTIIDELIELVELGDLASKYPNNLSGGQQQRVALARALVRQPRILLLDEPLSALDYELRTKLQAYLLKIHQQYKITTLLVSHDVAEIRNMADRVLVLRKGKILEDNTPKVIFYNQNKDSLQVLEGEVAEIGKDENGAFIKVKIGANLIEVPVKRVANYSVGQSVKVLFNSTEPRITI